MKFFRLDLLTLLISLFVLASCKNENTIGLPVGDQQLNGTLAVYDDIVVKTDTDNTPLGSGLPKTPLASFNDPELGLTESSIATSIGLPNSSAYTLPAGTITTDSAVLELHYNDGFYGDSLTSKYKVSVYQLRERPSPYKGYLANKNWDYDAGVILNDPAKSSDFNARPKTKFKIYDIVTGKADTLLSVDPQIRIALKPSFINNIFFNAPAAQLASNAVFEEAVKGLYVKVQRSQASQAGGIMMFNMATSKVSIYYRANNSGTIDTAMVQLPLNAYAAQVKHTYSTSVQAAINGTSSNNVFYLQGLAGLRAKISFPTLKNIFGTSDLNSVAINRAELIVTPVPNSGVPYVPQPQLTLYGSDIALQRELVPDANAIITQSGLSARDVRFISAAAFGGGYDKTRKEYHFLLTGYIQDLVSGKLVDRGTYLGAIDTTNRTSVDIAPTIQTAGRTIAVGSDKTSANAPYRIRLNIIYTKNN